MSLAAWADDPGADPSAEDDDDAPACYRAPDPIWWLHPGKLLLVFVLPVYLFLVLVIPSAWPNLVTLRAHSYMTPTAILLGAATLLIFSAGCFLGAVIRVSRSDGQRIPYLVDERSLKLMGLVTLAAYAIWFWPILSHGQLSVAREDLNRIPGVTSFTQLGVPFVSLYLYGAWSTKQSFSRSLRWMFVGILAATVLRVYVWSERLALIEVGVPVAIAFLVYRHPFSRPWSLLGAIKALGPYLGLPVLIGFFALTEMFRSWTTYSQTLNISFSEFIVSRVVSYYYTAINNGAGILANYKWPSFDLVFVLEWLHRLPGIGVAIWKLFTGRPPPEMDVVEDPEFNNISGIYPIFYDLGLAGGLAYFLALGLVFGAVYRSLRNGGRVGTMFYAPAFVATLEVLRIYYVNSTRTFIILVGSLIAVTRMRPVTTEDGENDESVPLGAPAVDG